MQQQVEVNDKEVGTPLPKKLGIAGDLVFAVVHAPSGFVASLGDTGDAIWQRNLELPLDVIIAFFAQRTRLRTEWPDLTAAAHPDGAIWVAWPKHSGAERGDITEDVLRADLLKTGWVDNKLIAIDETWNALRFAQRKDERHPRKR